MTIQLFVDTSLGLHFEYGGKHGMKMIYVSFFFIALLIGNIQTAKNYLNAVRLTADDLDLLLNLRDRAETARREATERGYEEGAAHFNDWYRASYYEAQELLTKANTENYKLRDTVKVLRMLDLEMSEGETKRWQDAYQQTRELFVKETGFHHEAVKRAETAEAEVKELLALEKQYCERLGELCRLCDEVIPWVLLNKSAPLRVLHPADEIMEYVEQVRP